MARAEGKGTAEAGKEKHMMDKLEKVIKGLQCCNTWSCAGLYEGYQPDYDACIECPFRCDPIDPEECHKKLLDSAISLLKEQEPRVMEPEEVNNAEIAWLENYICMGDGAFPIIKPIIILECKNGYLECLIEREDDALYTLFFKDYNYEWRLWTSRPTDEQRKATPWTG